MFLRNANKNSSNDIKHLAGKVNIVLQANSLHYTQVNIILKLAINSQSI